MGGVHGLDDAAVHEEGREVKRGTSEGQDQRAIEVGCVLPVERDSGRLKKRS